VPRGQAAARTKPNSTSNACRGERVASPRQAQKSRAAARTEKPRHSNYGAEGVRTTCTPHSIGRRGDKKNRGVGQYSIRKMNKEELESERSKNQNGGSSAHKK
jgi:hypothetical protein